MANRQLKKKFFGGTPIPPVERQAPSKKRQESLLL
jgi:hypothetical protein